MIKVSCHKLLAADKLHMAEICFLHRGHKTLVFLFVFSSSQALRILLTTPFLDCFPTVFRCAAAYETSCDTVNCSVDTDMLSVSFRVNGEGFLKNRVVVQCSLDTNLVRASLVLKCNLKTGRMAHWIKALATKPHGLSSSPRIHMVEGEKHLACCL